MFLPLSIVDKTARQCVVGVGPRVATKQISFYHPGCIEYTKQLITTKKIIKSVAVEGISKTLH